MPGRTKVTKMIDELYEDMLKLKDIEAIQFCFAHNRCSKDANR